MDNNIKVGDKVQVICNGIHKGKTGTIRVIYPAGMYDNDELYHIDYHSVNSGQFKREELLKMEDIL